ncbi:MAG: DUF2291 domain-containing protein [Cyclobacteriaceae bacterium]
MKKKIKYIIGIIIGAIVLYNSVYFMPLDEKIASEQTVTFDAESFVDDLWGRQLQFAYDTAIELSTLINQLKEKPQYMFDQYGLSLGIGNIAYFKTTGIGIVQKINENNVLVRIGEHLIEIETEFIFGNAIRDASGLIKINDFDKTSDFNGISEAINRKVREEVIPNFRQKVKEGDRIQFHGALELNKAHLHLDLPEIIPVSIEITS